jgi:hypothetical protein
LAVLEALGEVVTIDGSSIHAVFDNDYLEALEGPGASVSEPTITARTVDLEGVERGSVVLVGNSTYRVREREPDGTGITLLRLRSG